MFKNGEKIIKGGKKIYSLSDNVLKFNNRDNKWLGCEKKWEGLTYMGRCFDNSEQIYQYLALYGSPEKQEEVFEYGKRGYIAKYLGNISYNKKLSHFWENRIDVFAASLIIKTKCNEAFRKKLLKTNALILVEYDYWTPSNKENIFAVKEKENCLIGYNIHGRLLMMLRSYLLDNSFEEWSDTFIKNFEKEYFI